MRAKEFIVEYATAKKPNFAKVSRPCPDCKGTGNVDKDGSNQTCPTCKGVGSDDTTLSQQSRAGFASDTDYQMNMPDTLWAAGKF